MKFRASQRGKACGTWAGPRIAADGVTGNVVDQHGIQHLMGWGKEKGK